VKLLEPDRFYKRPTGVTGELLAIVSNVGSFHISEACSFRISVLRHTTVWDTDVAKLYQFNFSGNKHPLNCFSDRV